VVDIFCASGCAWLFVGKDQLDSLLVCTQPLGLCRRYCLLTRTGRSGPWLRLRPMILSAHTAQGATKWGDWRCHLGNRSVPHIRARLSSFKHDCANRGKLFSQAYRAWGASASFLLVSCCHTQCLVLTQLPGYLFIGRYKSARTNDAEDEKKLMPLPPKVISAI